MWPFLFVLIRLAAVAVVALSLWVRSRRPRSSRPRSPRFRSRPCNWTRGGWWSRWTARRGPHAALRSQIVWAASPLRVGTQVGEESPLFRIRQTRYSQAVAEARSRLAEAELRVLRERAAAELARTEWERTGAEPDPLALGIPPLTAAEEGAAAAQAALDTAEADLHPTSPLPAKVAKSGTALRAT